MKRQNRLLLLGFAALMTTMGGVSALGDESGAERTKRFIRVLQDEKEQPLALQTSIVRYSRAAASSPSVDLIGAVHVGEKAYYQRLNEIFQRYDAVLYELVAPEESKIPQPERRSGYRRYGGDHHRQRLRGSRPSVLRFQARRGPLG